MLTPKFILFLAFIWITGIITGAIFESASVMGQTGYLGGTKETAILNKLMFWRTVSTEESWGVWEMITAPVGFFDALFQMVTFQFSFIETGSLVWWMIFGPMAILFTYGLIMTMLAVFRRQIT